MVLILNHLLLQVYIVLQSKKNLPAKKNSESKSNRAERGLEGRKKSRVEEPPYVAPTLQEPENNLVQEVSDATSIHFSWKKQQRDLRLCFYLYRLKDFSEELVLKRKF